MPIPDFKILRTCLMLVAILFAVARSAAQVPTAAIALSSEQRTQLHDLVSRTLSRADQVRCKAGHCDVLVANFTDQKGNTSILGMQLAEEVSKDESFVANHIRTTPRAMLQSYLETQRIPSKAFKDTDAARWLGRELFADAVLVGQMEHSSANLKLELRLIESKTSRFYNSRQSGLEQGTLPGMANQADLAATEPYGQIPEAILDGQKIPKLAADQNSSSPGMTMPRCEYQPDPPYTESARQSKYQGIVILQAVISKDGRMLDVRPLAGAPFGLNKISVETVRTWRCRPPTVGDKPISVVVPIEISFRLF
ncbi:MAG TPA: energy transducer TonB [Candidatus Angelobacter sp.]|nr:energy transducer TonB [Candidatus Angelobacter sp.]